MNDDLLVKYLAGDTDEWESRKVREWIASAPEHGRHFEQLRRLWDASGQLAPVRQADEERAWSRFRDRIRRDLSVPQPGEATQLRANEPHTPESLQPGETVYRPAQNAARKRSPGRVFGLAPWQVAASLVFLLAAGWLVRSLVLQRMTTRIESGELVRRDTLPDGSIVILNKRSRISYPKGLEGDTRQVRLEGEAFFEVAPDPSKPFIIRVNRLRVQVVGTSFNIKEREGGTEVIVESGVVKVRNRGEELELRAGERTTALPRGELLKENQENELYKYYRTRKFVCEGTPFGELLATLNDAYGVNIELEDKRMEDLTISITVFSDDSLGQVLQVIADTFGLDVLHEKNRIILKKQ